jgi:pimeloyl-ACP methyl ester carboxylesterase
MSAPPPTGKTAPVIHMGSLHDEQVVAWLRSGENAATLSANFGEAEYLELRRLARAVGARRTRGGPRVLILPGIMGSKIGTPGRVTDDVLWLDPVQVIAGKLTDLALPQGSKLQPLGVMLFGYLKLKLCLQLAGFDASFHPFDWRLGLDTLGKQLGDRIASERATSVRLVAHSMGGLVARAALNGPSSKRIVQLIQLGTPNYGSFAPVQALRATYPTVRKIAALDWHHTAEQLAEQVFRTLPGLYQMLPAPDRHPAVDFFDPRSWPADAMAPDAALLKEARRVREGLAPADERCCLIVGVNQETVTGARRVEEQHARGEGRRRPAQEERHEAPAVHLVTQASCGDRQGQGFQLAPAGLTQSPLDGPVPGIASPIPGADDLAGISRPGAECHHGSACGTTPADR